MAGMNAFMIDITRELLDLPLYITLGALYLQFTCLQIMSASCTIDSWLKVEVAYFLLFVEFQAPVYKNAYRRSSDRRKIETIIFAYNSYLASK